MCASFLIGNLPNSIAPILFELKIDYLSYHIYLIVGNFMLFISHSSNFFCIMRLISRLRNVSIECSQSMFSEELSKIN